ncbi:MAG: immune inhibitor A [Chloroflexota bacterium]
MMEQPTSNNNNNKFLLACGGCLALLVLTFVCLGMSGIAAYFILDGSSVFTSVSSTVVASVATVSIEATPGRPTAVTSLSITRQAIATPRATTPPTSAPVTAATAVPQEIVASKSTATPLPLAQPAAIIQEPIPPQAYTDLAYFFSADYPAHDYFASANRLGKYNLPARTVTIPGYQVGDSQTFITDEGNVEATLMAATDHAYFWVEDGLNLAETAVIEAANKLENEYYPLLVNLFGQEWQPGVDNDPHFSVLHLRLPVDAAELGYFTGLDEYPRDLYYDSNEQEMLYLNMSELVIGEDLYYGTLVHELQHLIQWHVDGNEAGWLNEGLSQLAELYVGLYTADTEYYLEQPDIRLNTWEYDDDVVDAHYAGAYLLSVYLWEQLGETAVQELSRHPANGMAAIRTILRGYSDLTLEQFLANWAVANYLDGETADPLYTYETLELTTPTVEKRVRDIPYERTADLNQYGVHYFALDVAGAVTIDFAGDTLVNLVDAPPPGSDHLWLAPSLDDTNAHLTFSFDLTDLSAATLAFDTWYDLEEDWDFAYVSVSLDDGATWDLLSGTYQTAGEYGPAWNGRSATEADATNGWLNENISLNSYLGKSVLLRFDLLTDSAINGQGFAVANVRVPELGVFAALETAVTAWDTQGFVQTGWQLPQQWQVQLIQLGDVPTVQTLPLNDLNQGQLEVKLGSDGGVLVIMPLTPFTSNPGTYWLNLTP